MDIYKEDGEAFFLGGCKEAVMVPQSWREVGAGWLCMRHTLADLADTSSVSRARLLAGTPQESRKGWVGKGLQLYFWRTQKRGGKLPLCEVLL